MQLPLEKNESCESCRLNTFSSIESASFSASSPPPPESASELELADPLSCRPDNVLAREQSHVPSNVTLYPSNCDSGRLTDGDGDGVEMDEMSSELPISERDSSSGVGECVLGALGSSSISKSVPACASFRAEEMERSSSRMRGRTGAGPADVDGEWGEGNGGGGEDERSPSLVAEGRHSSFPTPVSRKPSGEMIAESRRRRSTGGDTCCCCCWRSGVLVFVSPALDGSCVDSLPPGVLACEPELDGVSRSSC